MMITQLFPLIAVLLLPVFSGTVGAATTDPVERTAIEGENVTLWSEVDDSMHVILHNDNKNTLLNLDEGKILLKKDRIQLNMKEGSIVMLNVQKEDSQVYHLQIYNKSGHQTTNTKIRLNVTEQLHQSSGSISDQLHQRNRLATYISVFLFVFVAVALSLVFFKTRESHKTTAADTRRAPGQEDQMT